MPASRLFSRTGAAALIAVVAFAASAAAANAGVAVVWTPSCDVQAPSQTFLPWLDVASYTPMPGGDFESSPASWSTNGPASIAPGNEPFHVGGAADSQSLALDANSSAFSPTICVGLEHPTIRFFVKRRSAGVGGVSTLRVDAFIAISDSAVAPVTIGTVTSAGIWQPTLPMPIVANLLPLLPGQHTPVYFRFTAQSGDWSIDDVWVDPYGRR